MVLDDFSTALSCSNANVLSEEGLSKITSGNWAYQPVTMLVWGVLTIHLTLLVKAVRADKVSAMSWKDDEFFTTDPHQAKHKESLFDRVCGPAGVIHHAKHQI